MNFLQVIFLGIVEGATEFLPISSTAHLILVSDLLGIQVTDFWSLFVVFIQFGAILAIVVLFWEKVLHHKQFFTRALLAFIPTGFVGFLMYTTIKDVFFQSYELIAASFIAVGLIFIVTEYLLNKQHITLHKTLDTMTYKDALLIGLIQSSAIVPGVSRAGAVLICMLWLKYKRTDAAFFSFLLAIPTIFAASLFDLIETDSSLLTVTAVSQLLLGAVAAYLAAFVCVKWFVTYLERHSTYAFGVYRIALGFGILVMLWFNLRG